MSRYKYKWKKTSLAVKLLVLGESVSERLSGGSKLSQLVSNHLFGHCQRDVVFAVVNEEFESVYQGKEMSAWLATCQLGKACQLTHPTKLGKMVQLLAFVRMAVLFLSASARLGNATKNGPVYRCSGERKMVSGYL